ncbi:Hypothetical predicted protein [Cloeon dipterum]|uniref:Uncharacterized protein n=1 Tax=Cloeon dipterum TaxID=197152 RepID=A0A8S1DF32_9INSE|nr:Hypothetical predicted protein [Cloeon dipterum]
MLKIAFYLTMSSSLSIRASSRVHTASLLFSHNIFSPFAASALLDEIENDQHASGRKKSRKFRKEQKTTTRDGATDFAEGENDIR